jgi:hypothetical protein
LGYLAVNSGLWQKDLLYDLRHIAVSRGERAKFYFMERGEDGWWRLPEPYDGTIPFLFSLQTRKPELS